MREYVRRRELGEPLPNMKLQLSTVRLHPALMLETTSPRIRFMGYMACVSISDLTCGPGPSQAPGCTVYQGGASDPPLLIKLRLIVIGLRVAWLGVGDSILGAGLFGMRPQVLIKKCWHKMRLSLSLQIITKPLFSIY